MSRPGIIDLGGAALADRLLPDVAVTYSSREKGRPPYSGRVKSFPSLAEGDCASTVLVSCDTGRLHHVPVHDLRSIGGVVVDSRTLECVCFRCSETTEPNPCPCPLPGPAMSQACADSRDGQRGGPRCTCRCHEPRKEEA